MTVAQNMPIVIFILNHAPFPNVCLQPPMQDIEEPGVVAKLVAYDVNTEIDTRSLELKQRIVQSIRCLVIFPAMVP